MSKFKVGDIVVGNKENNYIVSGFGVKCRVVDVTDTYIIVEITDESLKTFYKGKKFSVIPEHFDLVRNCTDHIDELIDEVNKGFIALSALLEIGREEIIWKPSGSGWHISDHHVNFPRVSRKEK